MSKTKHNKKGNLRKTQKMKKMQCSPKQNPNTFSCYSDKSLHTLKRYWNARHPDIRINTNDSREIWQSFKKFNGEYVQERIVLVATKVFE